MSKFRVLLLIMLLFCARLSVGSSKPEGNDKIVLDEEDYGLPVVEIEVDDGDEADQLFQMLEAIHNGEDPANNSLVFSSNGSPMKLEKMTETQIESLRKKYQNEAEEK